MRADLARQREEHQRLFERDVLDLPVFGKSGAFWLVLGFLVLLAELEIGAEPADAQKNLKLGRRINPEHLVARAFLAFAR